MQFINISAIARDAGLKTNTVSNHFDLIEDMLISYRIPVFTKRVKRRLVSHPKFYYFDAGVFYHLRHRSILDSDSKARGASLETLILQDILAINHYLNLNYQIYYWRTHHGKEVDFILLGKEKLIAIEIKHSSKVHPQDLKGLKTFKEDYPEAELKLVYLGEHKKEIDGVEVIPANIFLLNLDKKL